MARKKAPPSEALFEQEDMEIYGSSMVKAEKKDPKRKTLTPTYMIECLEGDIIEHAGVAKRISCFMGHGALLRDKDDSRITGWGELYCINDVTKEKISLVTMASVGRRSPGRNG